MGHIKLTTIQTSETEVGVLSATFEGSEGNAVAVVSQSPFPDWDDRPVMAVVGDDSARQELKETLENLTGQQIASRVVHGEGPSVGYSFPTDAYKNGWDRIFGN